MFVKELFFRKVREDEGGCHQWVGARNIWGYGRHKIDGRTCSAHRTAWELANGSIPAGLCVLHHCDNRRCVNPAHLYLGTHADNMRDMLTRGRAGSKGTGFDSAVVARLRVGANKIGEQIICQRCAAECERKGTKQKYCEACRAEAYREHNRRYRATTRAEVSMTKPRQLNIRIEQDLWDELAKTAELQQRSVGNVVRMVLGDWQRGTGRAPASQRSDGVAA